MSSYVEINLSDILVHVYIHKHLTKVNKKIPYLSYIHLITIQFSLLNIAINTFVNYISSFIIKIHLSHSADLFMPLSVFFYFKAFIDNLDQQANDQNTLYLLLSKSKKKKSL